MKDSADYAGRSDIAALLFLAESSAQKTQSTMALTHARANAPHYENRTLHVREHGPWQASGEVGPESGSSPPWRRVKRDKQYSVTRVRRRRTTRQSPSRAWFGGLRIGLSTGP